MVEIINHSEINNDQTCMNISDLNSCETLNRIEYFILPYDPIPRNFFPNENIAHILSESTNFKACQHVALQDKMVTVCICVDSFFACILPFYLYGRFVC